MRRTFVCLGDAVNLAARLMSRAPAGQVYVHDDVRRMAGDAFLWEALPGLQVKGKQGVIVAHRLSGSLERASRRRTRFELPLIGRRAELSRLEDALDHALRGEGRIVGISAEAGMGKSRLLAEFVRAARRRGLVVAFGECQSFGTTTSYFVWDEIWRRLLHLDETLTANGRREHVEARLAAIDPTLVARAPLLNALLDVEFAETDLTAELDAKVRKASLEDLLATALRARAAEEPLVIVVEDAHWIDALSRDLLIVLGRAVADRPVLIVTAYRPAAEPGGDLGVDRLAHFTEVRLDELAGDDAVGLIRAKLAEIAGSDAAEPSGPLVRLITERSEGNPFYIEELVSYVIAREVDPADPDALERLELPTSLHTLVLSRIDEMPESPRRTLKVASVVGRVFEAPVLPGAYPDLGPLDAVVADLDQLRGADLVLLDRAADLAYLFKHVATQEVAYESLPYATRSMLHGRVGSYLEASDPAGVEHRLDLLAHHFWNSDDDERKRHYLRRAADAARAAYANDAAIRYLERLVPLLDGADRVDALLQLAKVVELAGDWTRTQATAQEALEAATLLDDASAQGWALHAVADAARKQGRFDEAATELAAAEARFRAAGDQAGLGQALQTAGTIAAQQGDYETAKARYAESVTIRQALGEMTALTAVLSNLGIVAEYQGDYEAARRYNEEALAIRRDRGERWGLGASANNLAMIALHEERWEDARTLGLEAVRSLREVGDAWMVAIARNTLANAERATGDRRGAADDYAAALRVYRDLDERWAMAFLFEDVGVLAAQDGASAAAFEFIGAADRLRDETGSRRAPALDEELARLTAEARVALGEPATEAALRRGRDRDLDAAYEAVLGYADAIRMRSVSAS